MYNHPLKSVLLHWFIPSKLAFSKLDYFIISIFAINSSLPINGARLIWQQVPICLAFALTEYKVQRATFETAVLDLQRGPKSQWKSTYKHFCSNYVELLKLKSLLGLQLLAQIILDNIANKPKNQLIEEHVRLDKLTSIIYDQLLASDLVQNTLVLYNIVLIINHTC